MQKNQYWAIKTPAGRLVGARAGRSLCQESFVEGLIAAREIADRPEWHGLHFYSKMWRVLRRGGFFLVKVTVSIAPDEKSGWTYPELTEEK